MDKGQYLRSLHLLLYWINRKEALPWYALVRRSQVQRNINDHVYEIFQHQASVLMDVAAKLEITH